jgi:hypothetical protein
MNFLKRIFGGGVPTTPSPQTSPPPAPAQSAPRGESPIEFATGSVSRAFESHIKKLEPQLRAEPETQAALNKVAAVFRQTSRMVGEKISLSATDGEMHSFSFRDASQKVRLEVTTIPCRPSEAYDYFARIPPGGYGAFLDRLLYLPAVYQPARAEGIQVFAHLIVVADSKSQRDQSGRDQVVVHLCMLPHGDGNQRYCPVGITPTDLLERR